MMKKMARWLLPATLLVLVLAGCSSDTVLEPSRTGSDLMKAGDSQDLAALTEPLQIEGLVATVEVATRTLTLIGVTESVIAAEDCEIFKMIAGVMTNLEFEDIQVGDSVRVCGVPQEDATILANKIRIFSDCDCPDCYLVFRDSIATIDYASGTFTVFGRPETITVDAATLIWSNLGRYSQALSTGGDLGGSHYDVKFQRDTVLAFTDLFVGAVVEVKSTVVDPSTLYAVSIKLAQCSLKETVNFEAVLASVDVANRIITFDGLSWIGSVCQNAELLGSAGESLSLSDFVAGELVSVKGFPLEADTLKICRMQKM